MPYINVCHLNRHADPLLRQFCSEVLYLELALEEISPFAVAGRETAVTALPELLLGAVLGIPPLNAALARHFNCPVHAVKYPEAIYEQRDKLAQVVSHRTQKDPVGDVSKNWFQAADECVTAVTFTLLDSFAAIDQPFDLSFGQEPCDEFISALLSVDHPVIRDLLALNHAPVTLLSHRRHQQAMQRYMTQNVVGQHGAITQIMASHAAEASHATLLQPGPRSIMTFVGAPGVGKTLLAESYAQAISEVEGSGYNVLKLNMELYNDAKNAAKLFGAGSHYSDAGLGDLTRQVGILPRTVIVFDEIEKAHANVLQALLSVLDRGYADDHTSRRRVDFSQCIVIFTTNLGQQAFAEQASRFFDQRGSVFDVLRQANKPSAPETPVLLPEFVSRLAKGTGVIFQPLSVYHLLQISRRLQQQLACARQPSYVTLAVNNDFADEIHPLFALAALPELTPRALPTAASRLSAEWVSKAAEYLELRREDPAQLQLQVRSNSAMVEQLLEPYTTAAQRVLLIDDERQLFELVKQRRSNVYWASSREAVAPLLAELTPDLVLLDVNFFDAAQTARMLQLADLIKQLELLNPRLPVYLLYEEGLSEGQLDDSEESLLAEVELARNVRGVHRITTRQEDCLDDIFAAYRYESALEQLKRRNLQIHMQWQVEPESGTDSLLLKLSQLTARKVMAAEDALGQVIGRCEVPETRLSDVLGLKQAKHKLRQVIQWMREPEKLASFGIAPPGGVLLFGPPGTGKTLLARAVAGECGMPFFAVNAAELLSRPEGGVASIQQLFEQARRYSPAVVFIDELDAIAAKRSHDGSAYSKAMNAVVNTLLTCMDGFQSRREPVLVIAATNAANSLDQALLRAGRFELKLPCEIPNQHERALILATLGRNYKLRWDADELKNLAGLTAGCSTAELQQLIREAIYHAVEHQQVVGLQDVRQALLTLKFGHRNHSLAGQTELRTTVAWHEAGHLLANALLLPEQQLELVTIEPRNRSLGLVMSSHNEQLPLTRQQLKAQLVVLMAGRAAECLLLGGRERLSSGAQNDLQQATELASYGLLSAGFAPEVGPIALEGLPASLQPAFSAHALEHLRSWLQDAETEALNLLKQHTASLRQLAEALLEHETLFSEQIAELTGKLKQRPQPLHN